MSDRNRATPDDRGHAEGSPNAEFRVGEPQHTAKHIVFRGHVQGVGFRYTAKEIAQQYPVAGFVRNLPDGTVEMLLQGPASDIDQCLREVQDSFQGHLRDTQVEDAPYNPRYTDFRVAF